MEVIVLGGGAYCSVLVSFDNSPYRQSQQPNMLAYGRLKKKIVKNFIFCLNKKYIHPDVCYH